MKLTNKGKCVDIIRWNLQGLELVSVQHFRGQGNEEKPVMKLRMNIQGKNSGGHENSNVRKFMKKGKTVANMGDSLNSMIFLSGLYSE